MAVMVVIACAIVLMLLRTGEAMDIIHARSKRNLVYQSAAVLQLTVGVQSSIMLPNRTLAVSLGLQGNFFLPLNITQLNPYFALATAGAAARAVVEEAIEEAEDEAEALEEEKVGESAMKEGVEAGEEEGAEAGEERGPEERRRRREAPHEQPEEPGLAEAYEQLESTLGRACVLRAVCEAAAHPLAPADHPGGSPGLMEELLHMLLTPSEDPEGVPEQYLRAERRGRLAGDCQQAFADCTSSPLDLVSQTVFW